MLSDGAGVEAGDGAIVGQPPANQRPQLQCWQVSALLAHAGLQLGQGWSLATIVSIVISPSVLVLGGDLVHHCQNVHRREVSHGDFPGG